MDLSATLTTLVQLTDHLVPTLGVLGALVALFFISKIKPYLSYVKLLANADTPEGQTELAKYIARQTGGKKIDTEALWEAFLPAAEALFKLHQTRKNGEEITRAPTDSIVTRITSEESTRATPHSAAVVSETNNRVSTETSAIATRVTTLESKYNVK